VSTQTVVPPVVRAADGGVVLDHAGNLLDWRLQAGDTGGALAIMEAVMLAGAEPPIHAHAHEDEAFHVLDGEITFVCGGRETRVGPGGSAFLPRGIAHGFRVETGTARAVVVMTPGGLEEAFHATGTPVCGRAVPSLPAHVDVEGIVAALAARGVTVTGPPPSVPGWGAHLTA
jgi:quercetin dioxygenase-like cupin family protein